MTVFICFYPKNKKTPEPPRTRRTPLKTSPRKQTPAKKTPSSGKSPKGKAATPKREPSSSGSLRASAGEARKGLSFDKAERHGASTTTAAPVPDTGGSSLLWVDKYRPHNLKGLIGQQGEQSCANKLLRWLQNWHTGNTKPAGTLRLIRG